MARAVVRAARDADTISSLPGLEADDRLYYRDLYDSLVGVSELVDSYRDLLSGATDMYLSTVTNRQGEINKQLTIIATVFGIGLLIMSVAGFGVSFHRQHWL